MTDRELTGNRDAAGWRPVGDPDGGGMVGTGPSPEATLVARTYLIPIRTSHDRALMLGLDRPRRHHNSQSIIS
jgi:hypothetical protein